MRGRWLPESGVWRRRRARSPPGNVGSVGLGRPRDAPCHKHPGRPDAGGSDHTLRSNEEIKGSESGDGKRGPQTCRRWRLGHPLPSAHSRRPLLPPVNLHFGFSPRRAPGWLFTGGGERQASTRVHGPCPAVCSGGRCWPVGPLGLCDVQLVHPAPEPGCIASHPNATPAFNSHPPDQSAAVKFTATASTRKNAVTH